MKLWERAASAEIPTILFQPASNVRRHSGWSRAITPALLPQYGQVPGFLSRSGVPAESLNPVAGESLPAWDLSPRSQGNQHRNRRGLHRVWSIPACAENSPYGGQRPGRNGSIPVRAGKTASRFSLLAATDLNGSIPACAGELSAPAPAAASWRVYPRLRRGASRRCAAQARCGADIYPRVCRGATQ